jgi:predicted house-cleaning NTP pyrophosphatase (Maf/HAM1 superfamily)
VVDGEVLGKPRDADDAAQMLGWLSGAAIWCSPASV